MTGPVDLKAPERSPASRKQTAAALVLLCALIGSVSWVTLRRTQPEPGWPDEWIYLTLARNVVERNSLNTTFYLGSSIEAIGYPHRDVHLPGYILTLAGVGSVVGITFKMAVGINVLCFFVSVLSAFALARRFLSVQRALIAAGLVALLPPYPGYLGIVYPEHVTAAALMALTAAAAWAQGRLAVLALGFMLGVSLLFRETLLFAVPLLASLVGLKKAVRFFLPGLLLAIVLVLPPLSARRAVHPNALYPSAVTDALSSPEPIARLTSTIVKNAGINLNLLFSSRPWERAEDAVLIFLLALALVLLAVSFRLDRDLRKFAHATLFSTLLLFAAMVVVYVVRERGGVWGGVRALMPMAPLMIVGLAGLSLGRASTGMILASFVGLSLYLDSWQIAYFNRNKGSSLEDQDRAATFIEQRTKQFAPRRVVGGRYFQYAYRNYPVEVVWSGAEDMGELNRLYPKFPFDFVVIHRRSPTRFDLRADPRYEWINAAEGQAAEYQIYRRVAP